MKYFRPELLARFRSRDDEVAEAAADEWEVASAAYHARLAAVGGQMPPAVAQIRSQHSLHDARLLGTAFGTQEGPLFGLLLRVDGAGEVLELNYSPVPGPEGGVSIKPRPDGEGAPSRDVWVLYDEFDFDEGHDFFTHSLLLSDGREIEVRFENLIVRVLDEVHTPGHLPEGERKWAPTEAVG
jgi:hypothetical protein